MANEFIVRKGLIALADSTISGSLNVTGTLTGDGSGLTGVTAVSAPAGTDGLIQYNNAGVTGGASTLYWDDANGRLGIGTSSPATKLHVVGSTYVNNGTLYIDSGNYLMWGNSTQGIRGVNDTSLEFVVGSSERMRITSAGNVGIGTTAPYTKLDIRPDALTGLTLPTFGTSAHSGLHIVPSGTATAEAWYGITFGNTAGGASERERTTAGIFTSASGTYGNNLYFATSNSWATGAVSRMMIDNEGRVGIGTTSPNEKLHVAGNIRVANSGKLYLWNDHNVNFIDYKEWQTSSTSGMTIENQASGGHVKIVANSNVGLYVNNNGNVGIGTTTPGQKLHVDGNIRVGDVNDTIFSNRFFGLSNAAVYLASNSGHPIIFNAGGTEKVRIANSGNVGIGTSSPGSPLEVYGSGSTVLDIQGSQGQLFSVTDSLTGSLMSVNDISGLPILEVFDNDKVVMGEYGNNTLVVSGSKVGIGTSAPSSNLHVHSAGGTGVTTQIKVTQADDGAGHAGADAILQSSGWGEAYLKLGGHKAYAGGGDFNIESATDLVLKSGGNNTRMFIHSNGNVGIGTTSPSQKLDVAGTIRQSGTYVMQISDGANIVGSNHLYLAATNSYLTLESANNHIFYKSGAGHRFQDASGNERVAITPAGNVGIGTTNPSSALEVASAGANGIDISADANNALLSGRLFLSTATPGESIVFLNNAGNLTIRTQGTPNGTSGNERVRIDSSGNVGIGTTLPAHKLHVAGNIQLNQTLYLGADTSIYRDGANILRTDDAFHANGNIHVGSSGYIYNRANTSSYIKFTNPDITFATPSGLSTFTGDVTVEGNFIVNGTTTTINSTTLTVANKKIVVAQGATTAAQADQSGIEVDGVNASMLYASASDSFEFNKSVVTSGDLTVAGRVTAQEFHTEFVSSSIIYESGSTKFGDTADDVHSFTGSLGVSGSIESFGELTFTSTTSNSVNSIVNLTLNADSDSNSGDAYRNIIFSNRGSEKARIDVNGNLGIGTATPSEKLDIVGKQIFSATGASHYGNPGAFDTDSNGDKIIFYNDGTSYDGRIGVGGTSNLWLKSYGETPGEGDIEFYAGGTRKAIIKGSGNVGIGTSNPSQKLSVNGSLGVMTGGILYANDIAAYTGAMTLGPTGTVELKLRTSNQERMRITSDGNVGIGTTNPTVNLHVTGPAQDAAPTTVRIGAGLGYGNAIPRIELAENMSGNDMSFGFSLTADGASSNNLLIRNHSNNITGNVALAVDRISGNIGVGATYPDHPLHVYSAATGNATNLKIQSTSQYGGIGFFENTANRGTLAFGNDGNIFTGALADSLSLRAEEALHLGAGGNNLSMTITTAGNVGIGTTSTSYKLTVQGGNNGINLSGTGAYLRWNSGDMQIKNEGSYKMGFYTYNTTAAALVNRMVIDTDGKVGIGTTTPQQKLSVNGGHFAVASGGRVYIGGANGSDSTIGYLGNDSGVMELMTDGTRDFKIGGGTGGTTMFFDTSAGNVGIGTTSPTRPLSVYRSTAGSVANFLHYTDATAFAGLYIDVDNTNNIVELNASGDTASTMAFQTGNAERMRITASGNVGIGTTTPGNKLHVVGGTTIQGDLRLYDNAGQSPSLSLISGDNETFSIYKEDLNDTLTFTRLNNGGADFRIIADPADYLQSYISIAGKSIGRAEIDNWNAAYSWGDHSQAGYLTSGQAGLDQATADLRYVNVDGDTMTGNLTVANGNATPISIVGTSTNYTALAIKNTGSGASRVYFDASNGDLAGGDYAWVGQNNDLNLEIANSINAGRIVFTESGSERMTISTGNVGIGTTSPNNKLEVVGNTFIDGNLYLAGDSRYIQSSATGPLRIKHTDGETMYIRPDEGGTISFFEGSSGQSIYLMTATPSVNGTSNDSTALRLQARAKNAAGTVNTRTSLIKTLIPDIEANRGLLEISGVDDVRVNANLSVGEYATDLLSVYRDSTSGQFATYRNNTGFFLHRTYADYNNDGTIVEYQERIGVDGNFGSVGMFSNHNFYIRTNNADRITILNDGNVGIGITAPTAKLDIYNADTAANQLALKVDQRDGSAAIANFYQGGTETHSFTTTGTNSAVFTMKSGGSNVNQISTSGNSYLNGGNVGIGTTSPAGLLHIYNNGAVGGDKGIILENSTFNTQYGIYAGINGLTSGGFSIFDRTNSVNRFVIQQTTGNVGIGTDSAGARLHVKEGVSNILIGSDDTYGANYSAIGFGGLSNGHNRIFAGYDGSSVYDDMYYAAGTGKGHQFRTNGSGGTKMVITSAGNVGIGTTNPLEKLHVEGAIKLGQHSAVVGNGIAHHTNGYLYVTGGTSGAAIGNDSYSSAVYAVDNGSLELYAGSSNRLHITSGGNVGIGTTSPAQKLHVNGAGRFQGALEVNHGVSTADAAINLGVARTDSGYAYLDLIGDTTYTDYGLRIIRGNAGANASSQINHRGTGDFEFRTLEAANITFDTTATERMRIDASGNVGIGTTTPTAKLDVNGGINITQNSYINWGGGSRIVGQSSYLRLQTSSQDRLSITNTGNVGIGTTNPLQDLHVVGNALFDGNRDVLIDSNVGNVRISAPSSGGWATGLFFDDQLGSDVGGFGAYGSTGLTYWFIGSAYNNPTMVIKDTGLVGIGTTNPTEELHIYRNNSNVDRQLLIDQDGAGDATMAFRLTGVTEYAIGIDHSDGDKFKIAQSSGVGTNDRLTIDSSGRVGVGMSIPTRNLDVAGAVRAGGKTIYTKIYGSLDEIGQAVAGLIASGNGGSAMFTFICYGGAGQYQKIVYSCQNAGGIWQTYRVIDEGTNIFTVEASPDDATITFTFKTTGGTQSYSPTVNIEHVGYELDTTHL